MAAVVPVTVCGRTFTMHVALESMNHGTSVWDGGVALAHFFDCNPKDFNSTVLRGKRVLELGSGCGLVSLVLASLGCHVVATDLPSVLPQLRLNVEANGFGGRHESGGSVTVEALDWAADEATHAVHRGVDIIVATDVVYHESVVPLLLECIRRIATPR
jgi:predicted nicotinamide N-methyase